MDSGAADTVGPPTLAECVPIAETKASKAGLRYNAADNGVITNLGEKELNVVNDLGAPGDDVCSAGKGTNNASGSVVVAYAFCQPRNVVGTTSNAFAT